MKINIKYPIEKWVTPESQFIETKGHRYSILECIRASKDEESFDLPIKGMNIDYPSLSANSLCSDIAHIAAVLEADLKYPIILAPTGEIMDGRHRVAKAILKGDETIKAVQLSKWPEGERISDEA